MLKVFFTSIHFMKFLGGRLHMSYFGATGAPVLGLWWRLLWIAMAKLVLVYLLFVEANIIYIPWGPPLMLHLPTSWQQAWLPVASQHAAVALGRSWFGIERSITRTEDRCATIIPATRLHFITWYAKSIFNHKFSSNIIILHNSCKFPQPIDWQAKLELAENFNRTGYDL